LLEAGSLKEGLMGLQRKILEVSSGTPTIRVSIDSLAKRAKALALHGGLQQHAALLQVIYFFSFCLKFKNIQISAMPRSNSKCQWSISKYVRIISWSAESSCPKSGYRR